MSVKQSRHFKLTKGWLILSKLNISNLDSKTSELYSETLLSPSLFPAELSATSPTVFTEKPPQNKRNRLYLILLIKDQKRLAMGLDKIGIAKRIAQELEDGF